MASVTTAHLVWRSSQPSSNVGSSAEDKSNFSQISLTNCGLRSRNKRDMLHTRTLTKAASGKVVRKPKSSSELAGKIVCSGGMPLIFISTEIAPWSKTGGLGDVLGGLPPALVARGHRVMTIAPRYDQYKDGWDTSVVVELKVGGKTETVRYFHCYKRGVDRVFVDHPMFLEKVWGKTGSKIYGPNAGLDYKDNQLRFSLFCMVSDPSMTNISSLFCQMDFWDNCRIYSKD